MGIGVFVGVLGGLLLAHAAYSTVQYRGMLKIMEEEFSGPPPNVIIELLLGLALCAIAGLAVPEKFHSILPYSEENRVVSLPANLDFMIFNHRGRALPFDPELKLKT
ncbi:Membrane magnesium transporter [Apostasia shenzhenica]|uniref:Membrane magnesium transporter n=1 Tax=Apostasia shenzhenica TaxID=1088818 RepID=A0A2I0A7K1_9ASPA|nr:Membrane magnesium transporter [Apostasia shenzhenica]